MTKLTKLQTAIIEHAAERDDGALLPLPEHLSVTDTAQSRALGGLVTMGFATPVAGDDVETGYVLTDTGRTAIATAGKVGAVEVVGPADASMRPGGKLGAVLKAIERKRGATLVELIEATGWQPHTTRAALTRLRQRGFPATLTGEGGRKAYRLQGRSDAAR